MIIVRDGKEIELTDEEVERAYREREHMYHCDDAAMCVGDCDESTIEAIVEVAERYLSKDGIYWDQYWNDFQTAADEVLKNNN